MWGVIVTAHGCPSLWILNCAMKLINKSKKLQWINYMWYTIAMHTQITLVFYSLFLKRKIHFLWGVLVMGVLCYEYWIVPWNSSIRVKSFNELTTCDILLQCTHKSHLYFTPRHWGSWHNWWPQFYIASCLVNWHINKPLLLSDSTIILGFHGLYMMLALVIVCRTIS